MNRTVLTIMLCAIALLAARGGVGIGSRLSLTVVLCMATDGKNLK